MADGQEEEKASGSLHVVLLPWLSFGHLFPFLHLAVSLAAAGIRVSFLSTPRNIRRLPNPPSHLLPSIRFIELPMPAVDRLPVNAEATVDLPPDLIQYLKLAFDKLRSPVADYLADESPDWILYDVLCHWGASAARDCGASCGVLSVFSATVGAFMGPPWGRPVSKATPESLTAPPDWISFPSTVAMTLHEAEAFHSLLFVENASSVYDVDNRSRAIEEAEILAVRSCRELEEEYLAHLPGIFKKPVFPTGFLPPEVPSGTPRSRDNGWGRIFQWLDAREPKSVVYVCFGSEYFLTREDVEELAHGLELAGVPFVWFLHRPAWLGSNECEEAALPEGFAARNDGAGPGLGLVAVGWAPQVEVVAHPSVGGALYHAGWGSTIETLQRGHVLITLPSFLDQGLNARLVVEKGLGFEVERAEDGSFGREAVVRAVRRAMVSPEGRATRSRARAMGDLLSDASIQERYARDFAEYLKLHRMERRASGPLRAGDPGNSS